MMSYDGTNAENTQAKKSRVPFTILKNRGGFAQLLKGLFGLLAVTMVLSWGVVAEAALYSVSDTATMGHGAEHSVEQSKWALTFFWMLAGLTLGSAIFVITRRNLVAAVIGMIATFFGLAGLFLMLYSGFLAAIQVLVYAGAIMVLFVFVIMILNREEDEPWAVQGLLGKALAGFGLLYLFARLSKVLWGMNKLKPFLPAPEAMTHKVGNDMVSYGFGSVKGVGYTLFTEYLFPFEAVSLVLLVAVVGAIAVARPHEAGHKIAKSKEVVS